MAEEKKIKKTAASKAVKKAKTTVEKKVEVKAEAKPVRAARLAEASPKRAKTEKVSLTAEVLGADGKKVGTVSLPKEIFDAKVNKVLMAQAVRVYLANQRQGTAQVKTRHEINGTTKKVWQQKGTGRARHGSRKAPIFVGGGVAHGPEAREHRLDLPQKMRKAALASALSAQYKGSAVTFVDGLDKLGGKTKEVARMLSTIVPNDTKKVRRVLVVTGAESENVTRAARNIEGVRLVPANCLNTYEVLHSHKVVFMKNAVEMIQTTIFKAPSRGTLPGGETK